MKTIFSLLILNIVFCSSLVAQDQATPATQRPSRTSRDAKRAIVFGLKAGANRSRVYDAQGESFVAGTRSGFAGGAFLAIPLGSFLGFQPELLYSQKGFKSTGSIASDGYSLQRRSDYMDVPLQLQLKPFRFFSLLAGVQYSYLLKQKDSFTYGANSVSQSQEFKTDNIRKNILGIITGFDINIQHLVLSGRAGWDLTANRGDGSSYTPRYRNLWLQATLGFRFY